MSVQFSSLGEEALIIMGQSPPGESYNLHGNGEPLLNGPTEFGAIYPTEKQWTTEPKKFCEAGDVLFCVRGATAGRLNVANKKFCIGRGLAAIRGKFGKFDSGFLRYVLANGYATFQSRGVGSTFINISGDELAKFPVPALPLAEQRRIAEVLDRAEALRAKRRAALAHLDSLTQSLFLDLFGDPASNTRGWPTKGIGDVCELIVDCVNRTAPVVDGPTPFKMIRTTNVREGRVNLASVRYVTEEIFNRWNRRATPKRGDVLLTREAPVGEAGIIQSEDFVFLGQRLMLYRADQGQMTPEYLLASFRGGFLQHQFNQHGSGSTVKHLPLPACRGFQIHVPPLVLQRQFARQVSTVERLKRVQHDSLAELDALFASLQHRAFRGEL